MAAWLREWQDRGLEASSRRPGTKALYKSLITNHLTPDPFGSITLDKLRPSDIDVLVLTLRGKRVRDKPLADATVQRIYRVLRVALDDAVRDGLLARNPAAPVKQPRTTRTEARFLAASEVTSLLKAAEGTRYHPLLVLIAATGLRRGEALALKWSDIDLEARSLRVRGTLSRVDGELTVGEPKSEKSRRTLPLSPAVVRLLKAQRKAQRLERVRAGNQWVQTGHVFTTQRGRPVEPRNLFRALETAADKAKLEDIGLHTLRHSAATAWLEAGVSLKAVSELLGHASIGITADCYGHVTEATSRAAMDALSGAIGL
jgi:integrase